jgi:hypothetical protein
MLMLISGTEGDIDDKYVLSKDQMDEIEADLQVISNSLPKDLCKVNPKFFSRIKRVKSAEFFVVIAVITALLIKVQAHADIVKLIDELADIVSISYSRIIDKDDIQTVKDLSESFFLFYESVFGASNVTINTHNILHVYEMLEKWGPLLNYHLFFYESMNHFFGQIKTSNRKTMDMEILKFCTRKNFNFFSLPSYPEKVRKLFFEKNEISNFKIPKLPTIDDVNNLFENDLIAVGNESLPEGSGFLDVGYADVLCEDEIPCLRKLFRNEDLDFPPNCFRFNSFKYGDAIYSSDPFITSPIKAKAGCLVGTSFNNNGSLVEYFTQICGFMKYEYRNATYYFMRVCYWRPRGPSGLLQSRKGITFFNKTHYYAPSRDLLIPVQRIYCRYALIADDLAVELNRKLRI